MKDVVLCVYHDVEGVRHGSKEVFRKEVRVKGERNTSGRCLKHGCIRNACWWH